MSPIKTFACLLIGALLGGAAGADEDRFYASLMGQYMLPDNVRTAQNDLGWRVAFGMPVTSRLNLELSYLSHSYDLNPAGSSDQSGFGVDALWFFDRDGALDPYLLLGLARLSDDAGLASVDYTSRQVGIGLMDDIQENLAMRAEIRLYNTADPVRAIDYSIGLGVTWMFGEAARTRVPSLPARRDSDGDGVFDDADACPGTPAGAAVDAQGCPPPADADGDGVLDAADACPGTARGAKVDARGCELDSDGDGVKDSADRCPNTPAGRTVDAQGCELDSDGDGVKDSADACPATPAGTRVDAKGCTLASLIELEGVTFETGSAQLTGASQAKLDEAAQTLKQNPGLAVEVAGHTDSLGDAEKNRALSQRRAESVRDYLVSAGVAADTISARGYGEDEPMASNDTAAGRAENRRVELRVK
jgi:OOP family OmpA-OmpF porin